MTELIVLTWWATVPFALVGLLLVPVAAAQSLVNAISPPLGAWMLRAGDSVSTRHSYVDPRRVRLRLRLAAAVFAAPGILGAPTVALLGMAGVAAPTSVAGWLTALVSIGVGFVGGPAAIALAVVGHRVGTGRRVSERGAVGVLVACGAAAALATATPAALGIGGDALVALTVATALWMAGAIGLANDLRIVAAWDRACTYHHPSGRDPHHG